MEPQAFFLADARDFRKRVDNASRSGPRAADHHKWQKSVPAILSYALLKLFGPHSKTGIRRDGPQATPSKPGHVRDLVKTVMGLFSEVDFGLAGELLQAMFAIFRKGPR